MARMAVTAGRACVSSGHGQAWLRHTVELDSIVDTYKLVKRLARRPSDLSSSSSEARQPPQPSHACLEQSRLAAAGQDPPLAPRSPRAAPSPCALAAAAADPWIRRGIFPARAGDAALRAGCRGGRRA